MKRTLLVVIGLCCAVVASARLQPDPDQLEDRLFVQGAVAEMAGDLGLALSAYSRLLALPGSTLASAEAAFRLSIELGRREIRDQAGQRLMELAPASAEVEGWLNALALEERFPLLDSLLDTQPEELHRVLRLARHADLEHEEAFERGVTALLQLEPELARAEGLRTVALWELLSAWSRLRDKRDTLAGWLRQSPLAAGDAQAQHLLALIELQLERRPAALQALSRGIAADSSLAELHRLKGLILAEDQRFDEAVHALEAAEAIEPDNPDVLVPLARVLERLERRPEAEARLSIFLNLYPGVEDSWLELIAYLERKGESGQALSLYKRAYRVFGDGASALFKNNFAYSLALAEQELQLAARLAEEAVREEPANAAYRDTLGWTLFLMERYAEAESELVKAYDLYLGNQDPEVLEHLGQLRFMQGNMREALALWQRSLELNPKNEALRMKLQVYRPADGQADEVTP